MDTLAAIRFLFALGREYAGPATVVSVANLGIAGVLHAVLPKRRIRLLPRVCAFFGAGLVAGPIAVAEALATVEYLGWIQEQAGLALVFLPHLLAPTTVAALISLVGDAVIGNKRPARAVVAAIAGALTLSPLVVLVFEQLPSSANSLPLLYLAWMLLGLPLAAGSALGYLAARSP